jgi:hypothetical protein
LCLFLGRRVGLAAGMVMLRAFRELGLLVCSVGGGRRRTVALNLTIVTFYNAAEVGPFRKIFEIKCHIIRFGEVIQVAGIEVEEVHGRHWADGRHGGRIYEVLGDARFIWKLWKGYGQGGGCRSTNSAFASRVVVNPTTIPARRIINPNLVRRLYLSSVFHIWPPTLVVSSSITLNCQSGSIRRRRGKGVGSYPWPSIDEGHEEINISA